jgi:hypothetical protein
MRRSPRVRGFVAAGLCLIVSGVFFVLYPAVRPFSDEVTLQGARAFASSAWVVAHLLAVAAFILLMLGILGLWARLQRTPAGDLLLRSLIVCWIGVGLTLPFYGAEVFGLHAIGQKAVEQGDVALVGLANAVRTGPGLPVFALGLLVLAAGSIMVAVGVWRAGVASRWGGIPLAVGFSLYIPQFFAGHVLRVAHGVIIAVGCIWLAGYLFTPPGGLERERGTQPTSGLVG